MVRTVQSMPRENVLDTLQTELEILLSERHPTEVENLFRRICEGQIEVSNRITEEGIRSVLSWSQADLEGYCNEVNKPISWLVLLFRRLFRSMW